MDPLAVLIYSHKADYQPLLEWQLKKAGIEQHHVVDPDFSWRRRQLKTLEAAEQFSDRMLIFPDAWDTVLLGDREEILALCKAWEGKVYVAGAKTCWPDTHLQPQYDALQGVRTISGLVYSPNYSPWRFVNSNPLVGIGRDIVAAIKYGWKHYPLVGDSSDVRVPDGEVCERFWTNLYFDDRVEIDTMCQMSQIYLGSLPEELKIDGGRIHNLVTGTKPIFIHLNGHHVLPEGLIEL